MRQARKSVRRQDISAHAVWRSRSLAMYAAALLGFTAIILTFAVIIGAHLTHRPLLGTTVPEEGRGHVPDFAPFTNQHFPPSSGPHYANTLPPGFYSTPVPEGGYVHNLEHGYIVVLFKRTAGGSLAEQLQDLPGSSPPSKYGSVKIIVAPYHTMTNPVIVLAWGRELPMSVVDRAQILRFYREYVDRGPEDVP